jgi:hypothetical protein
MPRTGGNAGKSTRELSLLMRVQQAWLGRD